MKYENLNHRARAKLREIYDTQADDKPTPPGDFVAPATKPKRVISTGYKTDIYAAMTSPVHQIGRGHANACLRVVGGSEFVEIDLPLDALPALIQQLTELHAELQAYNAAIDNYLEQKRAYEFAKAAYEDKREAALTAKFGSGKFTEAQIESMVNTAARDDIPF